MTTLVKNTQGNYIVKPGDDLTSIALSQGRTLNELLATNPQFRAPTSSGGTNLIHPGDVVNMGIKTAPSTPSYSSLTSNSQPSQPQGTPSFSNLPTNQSTTNNPTTSFTKGLIDILKNAQGINQSGQARLLKQGQDIKGQGLEESARIFNNKNLAPNSGTSLGLSAQDSFNPLSLSVENQQKLGTQNLGNVTDIIDRTQKGYDTEQDRIHQIAQDAANEAYRKATLAETIRSHKADEGIKSSTTTNNLFGNAKLTTGQKNDLADMLVLQKQIEALSVMKGQYEGYIGAGPLSGVINQPAASVTGKVRPGAQDIRNNIGQIQGFIAKLRGGTSFTPNEQRLLETYTPTVGNSDAVIDSKLKSLNQFINDKISSVVTVSGGNYTAPVDYSDISEKPGSMQLPNGLVVHLQNDGTYN